MRYLHLILIGVAIPLLLTATVFAAPSRFGIFSTQMDDATNALRDQNLKVSEDQISAGNLVQTALAMSGKTHTIVLGAQELDNGLFAYKMISHKMSDGKTTADFTSKYPGSPTILGPTIVVNEGDQVILTLKNQIGFGMVSTHVHGVHYDINSDGTLKVINNVADQGATPGKDFTVKWVAGPGTVGSWPYHDHTLFTVNGAENKGLFGMIIVNPATGKVAANTNGDSTPDLVEVSSIKKDFVLYMNDDAFWGTEILPDGTQRALWTNPTLVAKAGDNVRFNIIPLGTDFHTFKLTGHSWFDPGTSTLITTKDLGPLENHAFVIKANSGTHSYEDLQTSNKLMGMKGIFSVTPSGGLSVPSPVPEPF